MDRWRGRIAVVTGAGSGIGAAIAYHLLDAGVNVVGLDRLSEKIKDAVEAARNAAASRGRQNTKAPSSGKLHIVQCDVSNEDDVIKAFKWVKENTKGVDILVNCAGICRLAPLNGTKTEEWKQMFDINVLGLSICTREALQQMKANGVDDGHVIHIGSVSGHWSPGELFAMYSATKHSVRVLTEGLRKELVASKSKIRVTEISPGLVKTAIADFMGMAEEFWKNKYMHPEDVADTVVYALGVPSHVQIHEIIVLPVGLQG